MSGDVVSAEVGKKKKGFFRGLFRGNHPAPNRIAPKCSHFAICGGCRLQHIPYQDQLRFKEGIIKSLFPFVSAEVIHPIIGMEDPWNYRNKMEFSFNQIGKGEIPWSDDVQGKSCEFRGCVTLSDIGLSDALKAVRDWWETTTLAAFHPYKDTGSLRTLTLREAKSSGDRFVILTVSGNPDYAVHKRQLHDFVEILKKYLTPETPGAQLGISLRIHQANQRATDPVL